MRKWMIGILFISVLAIGGIYYFIPAHLHITSSRYVQCNSRPAADLLLNEKEWTKWNYCSNNSFAFHIKERSPYAAAIAIKNDGIDSLVSVVNIILYRNDSTGIEWKCDINAGNNPYGRVMNYYRALEIKKCMDEVLSAFSLYAGNEKNIYGVNIDKRKFIDTFMISTQTTVPDYPNNSLIYEVIDKFNTYAASKGAHAINPPMLNIEAANPFGYTLKLAIPINKEIPSTPDFRFRFMIQGNTLFAQVKGGPRSIENTIQQMQLYIGDFHYSSPAIPFESMVTDRLKETDSSKWITNIYYPVM